MDNRLDTLTARNQGRDFLRLSLTKCAAGQDLLNLPGALEQSLGRGASILEKYEKANVAAQTLNDLGPIAALARPWLERVTAESALQRLPLVPLPATGAAPLPDNSDQLAAFVAAGAPIPVWNFAFGHPVIDMCQLPALLVVLNEALHSLDGPRLAHFERLLQRVVIDGQEEAFFGTAAAVTGTSPVGMLNGLSGVAVGSPDDIAQGVSDLLAAVRDGRGRVWFVLSPRGEAYLRVAFGSAFGTSPDGPTFAGRPFVVTAAAGNKLIALDVDTIGFADGGLTIESARHASLQMLDNPTNSSATGTATNLISLWQSNATCLRVVRWITWVRGYTDSAAFLEIPALSGSPS